MKVVPVLDQVISQAEFAEIVGLSEARVSQLISEGMLERGATAHQWLIGYCERLRDIAAGRASQESGGLDLVQERAALAREQRIAQALKNAVSRQEYAPIGMLSDVLAAASSAVVDRFDALDGTLRKACPDLPDEARTAVHQVIASARNEWIRATERLIAQRVDDLMAEDDQPLDQDLEAEAVNG